MQVKIKLIKADAKKPAYSRAGDAGLDLFSCEDKKLLPGERHLFKLGFAAEIPSGNVALVWDRGGMATNHGIHSLAGVIDSNYRGEFSVVLHNTSPEPYSIKKGDKIAQLLVQPVQSVEFVESDNLSDSNRGDQGWFSSGK